MRTAVAVDLSRHASTPRVESVDSSMGRWSFAVHGERRRPGDPDILLLHPLFVDSAFWRGQLEPLARLGRVVALDMPGHGRSDVPPPFDLNQQAEALVGAFPAMEVERAICVGASWGGALALHLALNHPACVAALALLGSSAERQTPFRRAKYRLLVAAVRRFGLGRWLARRQIAPLMFSAQARREQPALVEEFVRSATAVPREALVRAALAVAVEAPDVLGRLGEVAVPTLVLCGREDRGYPPALSEHLAAAVPGARLAWIEGAGHLAPLERPDEVARLLVPFVARLLL
jgi:pimeloyl-ACP methyl ester carboxylesterase